MASDRRNEKSRARIEAMGDHERRLLYKRAARLRKAAAGGKERPKHRPDYESWDDEDDDRPAPREKRRRRPRGSLQEWAEALAQDDEAREAAREGGAEAQPATVEALVLWASSGRCRVLREDEEDGEPVVCDLDPAIAAFQRTELAVGDRVEVAGLGGGTPGPPRIVGVRPRRTRLSRPDSGPGGRFLERVIAANVDRVVVVASVASPPLRVRLLDRYLIAIERGGARPAVVLTKWDLLTAASEETALRAEVACYAELGVPVVESSSLDGRGLEDLRTLLQGELSVFVGPSGVGKSSLLNALDPALAIETRAVGSARKGRHTTTSSTLHRVAGGGRIIDTPGIREFGLWRLTLSELRYYFHEFDDWAPGCRFRDCTHLHEPGCAVRAAARSGGVPATRYDSYRRLASSLPD